MKKNKVLVPLNQSEQSQEIISYLKKFFPAKENNLILYYVTKPPTGVGFKASDPVASQVHMPGDKLVKPVLHPIYATQQQDSIKAHVEAELMPVTRHLEELGYDVSVLVGFSKDPIDAISRIITKNKIDLVAMSTRARVGVTRFFFGNMADKIARKAKIPMLLIHPSKK